MRSPSWADFNKWMSEKMRVTAVSHVQQPKHVDLRGYKLLHLSLKVFAFKRLLSTLKFDPKNKHMRVKTCFARFTVSGLAIQPNINFSVLLYVPAQIPNKILKVNWNGIKK